jgi:hypothetical protein
MSPCVPLVHERFRLNVRSQIESTAAIAVWCYMVDVEPPSVTRVGCPSLLPATPGHHALRDRLDLVEDLVHPALQIEMFARKLAPRERHVRELRPS